MGRLLDTVMRHYPALSVLVLALVLAIIGTTTPWPAPADRPLSEFSAGRAMADIRVIACGCAAGRIR